jgi:hypothetical protein
MNRSILVAALLVSAAILINGYLDRTSHPSHLSRPSTSTIKKQMVDSINYAIHGINGDNIIMNKKRDVQDIQIGDIRFAEGDSQISAECLLVCADGDHISSDVRLVRDDFGIYRGSWDLGAKKAVFEIK